MSLIELRIIEKMNNGTFKVDPVTLFVSYYHSGRKRWYPKLIQYHSRSGRAKVNFHGGKTIYMNRLVWMWLNRKVPSGVIDHIDRDRTNDIGDNLQPMSKQDSDRQGWEMSPVGAGRYSTYASDIPE